MVKADKSGDGPVIIKKYANRRLYNTARSSYVTLDDLSRMVRAGEDFKVFDAKTGEEITRSVLTQIIFEEEAKGQSMLPTNFLRQIIGLYGDALQSVVPGYLDASMDTFRRNQEKMRAAFGTDRALQTFETMARCNMEWFEQTLRMFTPPPGAGAARGQPEQEGEASPRSRAREPGGSQGADPAGAAHLEALQQQLRDMQAQLEKLAREEPAPQPEAPADDSPSAPRRRKTSG